MARSTLQAHNLVEASPAEAGFEPAAFADLRGRLSEWAARGDSQAIVAAVAKDGKLVLHEAFGRQAHEPEAPSATTTTVFPVSSIAKPVVASLVIMLVQEGRLRLNVPVRRYLPELTGEGTEEILVRHLLLHLSLIHI